MVYSSAKKCYIYEVEVGARGMQQEQRVVDFVHWVLLHPDYASVGYAVVEYVFHLGVRENMWEMGEKILLAHLGCRNRVEMVQVILGHILRPHLHSKIKTNLLS